MIHVAKCEICGSEVKTKSWINYQWYFYLHFEKNHPAEFEEIKKAYQEFLRIKEKYHYHGSDFPLTLVKQGK